MGPVHWPSPVIREFHALGKRNATLVYIAGLRPGATLQCTSRYSVLRTRGPNVNGVPRKRGGRVSFKIDSVETEDIKK